jgi:hypothetical protein
MKANLFRHLKLALLPLVFCAGPVGAAEIYDCEFAKALYLTDQGYIPNDAETKLYASGHILIDKVSGVTLGPMFTSVSGWKRIRAASDYETFKATGYNVHDKAEVDIYVQEFLWDRKKMADTRTRFVSVDQQSLTIYFGTCK